MKPTQEQVIAWVEKAGVHEGGKDNWVAGNRWETALALAYEAGVVAEREACAALCDKISDEDGFEGGYADYCAHAIRERGAP